MDRNDNMVTMKRINLNLLVFVLLLLSGCGDAYVEETVEVTDSLNYKQLLGTYIFKPNAEQASKLKISPDSVITLRLTSKKPRILTGNIFEFQITKMIFVKQENFHNQAYTGGWRTFYSRDSINNHNVTVISFYQNLTDTARMSYQLHINKKDSSLHILGFTSDPKYEVMKIFDFKKVR